MKANFSKKMLDECIFNVIINKLQIFWMIFRKIWFQFLIRIRINNLKLGIQIRILQKVLDPCGSGSGSGSTTLVNYYNYLYYIVTFLQCKRMHKIDLQNKISKWFLRVTVYCIVIHYGTYYIYAEYSYINKLTLTNVFSKRFTNDGIL
jgi:hypothetical protein